MCLNPVYVGLLQICQITETHLGVSYRQIDRKHLTKGGLIVERGKLDDSAGVTQLENFVIRLPVVR